MKQIHRILCCIVLIVTTALLLTACGETDTKKNKVTGGYMDKAEGAAGNTIASTLYQAAQTALRDLDLENVDLTMLSGDYSLRSSDLTNATPPQDIVNESDAVKKLWCSMQNYLDKTVTFDKAIVSVKDGVCAAVAVQTESEYDSETGETIRKFGCYPNALNSGDSFQNLEDVLAHAKG